MKQRSKGVSSLISSALLIAIAAGAATTLVMTGSPLAESLRETRTLQTMLERMPELGEQVETVGDFEEISQKEVTVSYNLGNLRVISARDEIVFSLETDSNIVTPRTSRKYGNVRISAGADVNVEETEKDGEDVFVVENEHVEFTVLDVPRTSEKVTGHWPLEDGQGQSFEEETGRMSEGTIYGAEWPYEDECVGSECLRFNEGDSAELTGGEYTENFSMIFWINPDTGGERDLISVDDTELTLSNDGYLEGEIAGESISSVELNEEEWQSAAFQADQEEISVFVNEEEETSVVSTGTPTIFENDEEITIGGSGSKTFEMDYISLYNDTMSEKELASRIESKSYYDSFLVIEDLVMSYRNRDTGKSLDNLNLKTYINNEEESSYGFGHTSAEEIGTHLPSGKIETSMNAMSGVGYRYDLELLSGSDFFTVDLEPR